MTFLHKNTRDCQDMLCTYSFILSLLLLYPKATATVEYRQEGYSFLFECGFRPDSNVFYQNYDDKRIHEVLTVKNGSIISSGNSSIFEKRLITRVRDGFTVTLTNLKLTDRGSFWCGSERKNETTLQVFKVPETPTFVTKFEHFYSNSTDCEKTPDCGLTNEGKFSSFG